MLDQDKSSPFTDEEFKAYEMQRMREIQGMINRGVVPEGYPYYGAVPPVVLVQQLHHQVALAEAGLEAHLQQVSVAQQTTWEAPEQAT